MTVLHNVLALSSLAVFLCSVTVSPVAALSTGFMPHAARHVEVAHSVAKAKRSRVQKRCRARSPPQAAVPDAPVTPPDAYTPPANSDGGDNNYSGGSNSGGGSYTPPANTAPTPAYASGKKGLAWPRMQSNLDKWTKASWYYNWTPEEENNSFGLEFIPMLWGWGQQGTFNRITSDPNFHGTVLGFNEPQEPGQSNMSPESAAELWRQSISPLKARGIRVGSPATSSNPNGMTWMKRFVEVCPDCQFDFVAVHWYDISADAFIAYVHDWHNTFGKPIWVTEWACQNFNGGAQCTSDETWAFVQKTVSFLENTDFVERYAYFGVMIDMSGVDDNNRLMDYGGGQTPIGNLYLSI